MDIPVPATRYEVLFVSFVKEPLKPNDAVTTPEE